MMKAFSKSVALILLVSALGSCAQMHPARSESAHLCVRDMLDRGDYHGAFRHFPQVAKELAATNEGAVDFEASQMADRTAMFGRRSWASILEDPQIALELKVRLVQAIHDNAISEIATHGK